MPSGVRNYVSNRPQNKFAFKLFAGAAGATYSHFTQPEENAVSAGKDAWDKADEFYDWMWPEETFSQKNMAYGVSRRARFRRVRSYRRVYRRPYRRAWKKFTVRRRYRRTYRRRRR